VPEAHNFFNEVIHRLSHEIYLLDSKNRVFRSYVIGECVNMNDRPLYPAALSLRMRLVLIF